MLRCIPLALLLVATPVFAQDVLEPFMPLPLVSDPLGEARAAVARGDPAEALARYLRVLAGNPANLEALTGAGRAALDIGDPNAAIGFYAQADDLAPRNAAIKAGIGAAMVQMDNPRGALRLFREAAELGVPPADIAADRGLAYDLRGDYRRAQLDYLTALKSRPDPETSRRLALSQAIGGDRVAALVTLDPLLRRRDVAAWRARAFVLAMTGELAGAQAAAAAVLPRTQAEALTPFLARLQALKPADKAAAVHLGRFPVDRARAFADAAARARAVETPAAPMDRTDLALAPSGRALGQPAPLALPTKPTPPPLVTPPPPPPLGTELLALISPVAATALPSVPRNAPDPLEAKADAIKAIRAREAAEAKRAEIAEKRKAALAEARAPARSWVQVAGGANKATLPRAWSEAKAKWPKQLAGRSPWTTAYRFTNRLLVGPFKSASDAQAYVNANAKDGFATFVVNTKAGDKVERLQ